MALYIHFFAFLISHTIALRTNEIRDDQSGNATAACSALGLNLTEAVYFPGDETYNTLNEDFFTAAEWLGPACIVTPSSPQEIADAVNVLTEAQCPFAIRGGGHMPIAGAANINSSGVLLSNSNMNKLELSSDRRHIEIGSGNKWGQVYQYLEPYKLTVVGGRAGLVGVPGFILGGGLSFFGNQYGWASANVVQFNCVLANGDIIAATADNEFSDLFWALRGGGNSFAIVTSFTLRTFDLPAVAVGEAVYEGVQGADFLDYVYGFAHNGSQDHKAGIEPIALLVQGDSEPMYRAIMFYDGDNASPAALANFTDVLEPVTSTFEVRPSMFNWTQEADSQRERLRGLRTRFNVVSIKADREAMQIIHDTFFDLIQKELADVENLVGSVVFIPIIENYITASQVNGGDPMDVDPTQAPYIWAEETLLWSNAADDAKITNFLATFNTEVSRQLGDLKDVLSPFLYLNYADSVQPVFQGYAANNLERLQKIRDKYDPNMVFTRLMPGGWKVQEA